MTWTDKELNDAEEAVTKFVEATGLSEKEVVEVFADGLAMFYKGELPDRLYDLIDELRATFDAY
jgi:hypothetical protein